MIEIGLRSISDDEGNVSIGDETPIMLQTFFRRDYDDEIEETSDEEMKTTEVRGHFVPI
jgi:hypothetical protein